MNDYGSAIESALHDVDGKNKKEIARKSERVLRVWLDMPLEFRSPGPGALRSKDG